MRIAVVVVAAGLGAAAWAQEARPGDGPLAGPKVREQRVRGVDQGFSDARREGPGARAGQPVPHRVFMQAIDGLRGKGDHAAPQDIRLTDDQEEAISALDQQFRELARNQGADARRPDRRERGPAQGGAPAGPPATDRPPPPPEGRQDQMRRNAARAADLHTKMFAELTGPQREYVDGRIAAWRTQMQERFGEQYVQRRMRERGAAPGEAPMPDKGQPPPQGAARERFRRLAEKMAQLPPEERERLLSRLEAEVDRRLEQPNAEGRPPAGPRPPRPDR